MKERTYNEIIYARDNPEYIRCVMCQDQIAVLRDPKLNEPLCMKCARNNEEAYGKK